MTFRPFLALFLAALLNCTAALAQSNQTIVVYGASGNIGGLIVNEALERGHAVIGVSRSPGRLTVEHANFTPVQGDVTDVESFTAVTSGADAVVISVQGTPEGDFAPENSTHALAASTAAEALDGAEGAPYVLQIGGATTMLPTVEEMLANAPFPVSEGTPIYAMLIGHKVALDTYRASDIDWTVLTPPFNIMGWTPDGISDPQQRGEYRTSITEFVTDADGNSVIYVADLAAAAVDEVENRTFVRQRFTIGY
ncbi:MAG: NAD(P)H-binding protein [Rhodospirillaceae bacterium]|nr:NAD(P)H-binding protein [Rhodospirillaceae bacterium]